MIPNVHVFRPADALETALCYKAAVELTSGPAVFSLTRQNLPQLQRRADFKRSEITQGGYIVSETDPNPQVVLVGTGSEVSLAVDTAGLLNKEGVSTRVVSMPCVELFLKQSADYREKVIPQKSKKVVLEAGTKVGWLDILQADASSTEFVTIERFGASAPASILAEKFGFTPEAAAKKIKERFC